MSDTIRSFIAVELERPLQEALHRVQERLQGCQPDVKWVSPANIHLTLKFLGEVPSTTIQDIIKQLPAFVAGIPPFKLTLCTVGAFPRISQPRVIWAGGSEDRAQSMLRLAEAIEKGTKPLGFQRGKKKFTAHVTLGRVRSTKNIKPLAEMLTHCVIPDGLTQTVQSVSLFKSTLTPQGPIYDVLSTAALPDSPR